MADENSLHPVAAQEFCIACQTTVLSTDPAEIIRADLRLNLDQYPTHHETFAQFHAAVEGGCYICTRVKKLAFDERGRSASNRSQWASQSPLTTYQILQWNKPRPQSLVFVDIYAFEIQSRFILYRSKDYPSPNILSCGTSSRQTRSLLRSWHEVCSAKHLGCTGHGLGSWTPTRLLDLGPGSSITWKICHPATDGISVTGYTTISYRWGNVNFPKLTSQSMTEFQSGLPYSSLPQVFQDAIFLTKDLGIRFIWIDALCIFQDSKDDFAQECARMSNVYSNSSCNIVATFGKDPYTSLFRPRDYHALQVGKFQHDWKTLESDPDAWLGFDSMVHEECLCREMLNCEVASRGWILQELLLAPRTVLFGMDQIHWMCRGLQACETWPRGNPPRITTEMSSLLTERYFGFHHDPECYWSSIVNRYSTLSLSNVSDKLPAISGLAKLFMQRTRDGYFAGHWKSALPLSLIWYIPKNVQYHSGWLARYGMLTIASGRPSAEYRAPSWSWASIDGIVDFSIVTDDETIAVLCSILNVQVDTAGGDPTGRVVGGRITIRAPWATTKPLRDFEQQKGVNDGDTKLFWDGASITDRTVEFVAIAIQWTQYSTVQEPEVETIMTIHGLILLPIQTHTGIYRRVGAFRARFDPEYKAVLDAFCLQLSNEKDRNVTVKDEAYLRDFEII